MATTCNITITSDIAPGFGGINESMTLTQAGNLTDIDSTTGFQLRKLRSTSTVDLVTMANELVEPKDASAEGGSRTDSAGKIYIRNIGDGQGNIDKSVGVTIGINAEPLGKLFGGDWLMVPLTCIDADDVTATPDNDSLVVLEYIMFYEEA
tara:strand:- start:3577 stop:4029 length:453 start_codon:yes stop_codon:yes gene_type:complete